MVSRPPLPHTLLEYLNQERVARRVIEILKSEKSLNITDLLDGHRVLGALNKKPEFDSRDMRWHGAGGTGTGTATWHEELFSLSSSQSSVSLAGTPVSANSMSVYYQSPGGGGAAFYPLIQTLQWSLSGTTVSFAPASNGDIIVIKYST